MESPNNMKLLWFVSSATNSLFVLGTNSDGGRS